MEGASDELLLGILAEARIEDVDSIVQILAKNHVSASDLIAESEGRAEMMLQQAGIPVGDCYKIMREIRRFNAKGDRASGGGSCGAFLLRAALGCMPCFSFICRKASGGKPMATMKCGLVVYSMTVLIITFTLFSFYLPAILYQARPSNRRISGHYLEQAQVRVSHARRRLGARDDLTRACRPLRRTFRCRCRFKMRSRVRLATRAPKGGR
jgi:hypothetical protein